MSGSGLRGMDIGPGPEQWRVNATILMGALAMTAWGVFETVRPTMPRFAGPVGLVIGIALFFFFFHRAFGPGWMRRMFRKRPPSKKKKSK